MTAALADGRLLSDRLSPSPITQTIATHAKATPQPAGHLHARSAPISGTPKHFFVYSSNCKPMLFHGGGLLNPARASHHRCSPHCCRACGPSTAAYMAGASGPGDTWEEFLATLSAQEPSPGPCAVCGVRPDARAELAFRRCRRCKTADYCSGKHPLLVPCAPLVIDRFLLAGGLQQVPPLYFLSCRRPCPHPCREMADVRRALL